MSSRNRRRERPLASPTAEVNLPRSGRLASLLLQIGVMVCVLMVIRFAGVFFFDDPKALVANLVGLVAASLCLMSARSLAIDRTDLLLGLFLLVSVVSASFVATERWEAFRAVGLTISGVAIFWSARYLAGRGQRRALLDAVAIAVVLVAVSIVIDAFGYGLDLPHAGSKGTQGNRNWAAHLLALGMPLLALQALAGQTARRKAVGLGALALCTTTLVLTRSRAAWIAVVLATALPLIVLAANSILSHARERTARCATALGALIFGVVLAVFIPTRLQWTSPHPYLESAQGIAAYNQGSGRARLKQYRRSLAMTGDHLLLGVGPGNWRIVYPSYFPRKTPQRLWYPRRGNSDWIVLAAERGVPATILFFAAMVSLVFGCWRSSAIQGDAPSSWEQSLQPLCAIAIVTALAVVGSLDTVLQLAAPTLVFFLAVGALAPQQEAIASSALSGNRRTLAILMPVLLAVALGLYLFNGMYADFLVARNRGDDLQVASRIAVDPEWIYNEIMWASFLREVKSRAATAGRE
jgi:putative inorganic carbon (HCO3(-)) transporter